MELKEGVRHSGRGTQNTYEEWFDLAAAVREKGLPAENSPEHGLNAVCATTFDCNRIVQYALNIVGFTRRVSVEKDSPMILYLLRVTCDLSNQICRRGVTTGA
jgi:DNA-binding IclR family transcriptional regulator